MQIPDACPKCWIAGGPLKERVAAVQKRVFLEGPQGSGKTTLARMVSEELGCESSRGFPTGEQISAARGRQDLICTAAYDRVTTTSGGIHVFDRSPISQTAFMINQTQNWAFLDCLLVNLHDIASAAPLDIFFISSTAELCLSRQDMQTAFSMKNHGEAARDVLIYEKIYREVQENVQSTMRCFKVVNDANASLSSLSNQIVSLFNN